MKRSKSCTAFNIFNYTLLTCVALVFLLPFWHVLMSSFSDPDMLSRHSGFVLLPLGGGSFDGYRRVLGSGIIMTGYMNTIIYAVSGTLIGALGTIAAAYVLSRENFRPRKVLNALIMFTFVFNAGLTPSYIIVRQLGWIHTRLAMIIPGCMSAIFIALLRNATQSLPRSFEESAKLDGASDIAVLFKVVLPLVGETAVAVVLMIFVSQWNNWFNARIYLGINSLYPLHLILYDYLIQSNSVKIFETPGYEVRNFPYGMRTVHCLAVLTALPLFAVAPALRKFFILGVRVGSLKG